MPSPTERLAMAALATGFLAVALIWLGSVAFAVGALAVLLGAIAYIRSERSEQSEQSERSERAERAERAGTERIGRSWAVLGMLGGMAPFAVAAGLMVASGFSGTPYQVPPFLG